LEPDECAEGNWPIERSIESGGFSARRFRFGLFALGIDLRLFVLIDLPDGRIPAGFAGGLRWGGRQPAACFCVATVLAGFPPAILLAQSHV